MNEEEIRDAKAAAASARASLAPLMLNEQGIAEEPEPDSMEEDFFGESRTEEQEATTEAEKEEQRRRRKAAADKWLRDKGFTIVQRGKKGEPSNKRGRKDIETPSPA
jgi:hypothetical protein